MVLVSRADCKYIELSFDPRYARFENRIHNGLHSGPLRFDHTLRILQTVPFEVAQFTGDPLLHDAARQIQGFLFENNAVMPTGLHGGWNAGAGLEIMRPH